MKFTQIILLCLIFFFLFSLNDFIEKGGMKHKLLSLIIEMIIILFVLIMIKYKKELQFLKVDIYQKKIEEYFKKETKK